MSNCILQEKNLDSKGYGKTFNKEYYAVHKKIRYKASHRLAYEKANGPIPEGMLIRHTCHTPNCVNPEHLVLGTHKDNMRDMTDAGRQARGERNAKAKLTEQQVREIKQEMPHGRVAYGKVDKMAAKYGISRYTIYDIWSGKSWSHLFTTK